MFLPRRRRVVLTSDGEKAALDIQGDLRDVLKANKEEGEIESESGGSEASSPLSEIRLISIIL